MTAKAKGELIEGQHVRLNKTTKNGNLQWCGRYPRSYYVKRLRGGQPLHRNCVDIRPTRETFQNFQKQSTINEKEEEVISARPESKGTGVRNDDLCGSNADDRNDMELPGLPLLSVQGVSGLRRSILVHKETQFYKP